MTEVEKMYENAGVKPKRGKEITIDATTDKENYHNVYYGYSPFTAEKQLELIKWLGKNKSDYGLQYRGSAWCNCCDFYWEYFDKDSEDKNFEESLAGLINILWQDLTEEERKQIRGILE